jgi:uncharacterized membrane protein YoaK (UPF0700 family)
VNPFLADIRRTFSLGADPKHGPLPPLLVAMTVVTGLVDAFSYLVLGHVFVANMTGNVIFLAFALAGTPGFSIVASVLALVAFFAGASAGGAIGIRVGAHRGHLLALTVTLEAGLIGVALVLTAVGATPLGVDTQYPVIALMAIALGLQNATARRLAVPDLTTTVLTLTITGTAADRVRVDEEGKVHTSAGRRTVSVLAIAVGALVGALMVRHVSIDVPLALAVVLLSGVGLAAASLGRSDPDWVGA